jgi:catalase
MVQQPITTSSRGRLCGVGAAVSIVAVAFVYLGGWLTPHKLTPARFVNEFQRSGGLYPSFRRNHAKGVGVSGFFDSNGQGVRLSKATVFARGRIPVIGRFSLGGTDPYAADNPAAPRGMGLLFHLSNGEEWRTAMINLPVFPLPTPQAFYDHLIAATPDPKTGKPDPAKLAAFVASHPETVGPAEIIKSHPPASGFENSTYNSLNAFWFTNANGQSIPVRWSMRPEQPFVPGGEARPDSAGKNYLFDGLISSFMQHPLRWHLIIIVGAPGDPTNDAGVPWPDNREEIDTGTLTLDHIESDDTSPARNINFDPLILPSGMRPSDDPLLSARSAVYSQSFTRRAGEKKEPAAVSPSEVAR